MFHSARSFLSWLVFPCIVLARSAPKAFSVWAYIHCILLQEPILFATKYFLFVYTVRDRSAPGAGFCLNPSFSVYGPGPFGSGSLFCLERNIVFGVWDRSAPGAGFCLKPSISVYGPGPFGSGTLFLFGAKYCACGLGPLGSGSRYWSHIPSGTVSLWKAVLLSGENFLLARSGTLSASGAGFIRQSYCYCLSRSFGSGI